MQTPLENFLRISLVGIFLSFPWAQVKVVVFGLPLYLPEVFVLLSLGIFLWLLKEKKLERTNLLSFDPWVTFGALLFFFGAVFSFLANSFSFTSLGMLKTWFFFPLLGAWLLYVTKEIWREEKIFFLAWFLASFSVALSGMLFLFAGVLTFDDRLQGWYTSPNFLAITVAPGILILSYFFQAVREEKKISSLQSLFLFFTLGLMLCVLFFTRSYGVWIAVFFSVLLFFWRVFFWKKEWKKFFITALLLIFLGSVFFFSERGSEKWNALVTLDERSSFSSREMIWRASTKIIEDHLVFGIGVGRFQEEYLNYQKHFPPYLEWAVPQPHNLYLALWLQTGVLGLVGFFLLVGRVLFLLNRRQATFLWSVQQPREALLTALIWLYLIYGFFDTPYFKTDLAFAFWMLIALTLCVKEKKISSH